MPDQATAPPAIMQLLEHCTDLCKRALAAVEGAIESPIKLEKVASPASTKLPDATVARIVDTLTDRGMVSAENREKLAASLSSPDELADLVADLAQFVRPAASPGMPAATLPSKSAALAGSDSSDLTEEEEERRGWVRLARRGLH